MPHVGITGYPTATFRFSVWEERNVAVVVLAFFLHLFFRLGSIPRILYPKTHSFDKKDGFFVQ